MFNIRDGARKVLDIGCRGGDEGLILNTWFLTATRVRSPSDPQTVPRIYNWSGVFSISLAGQSMNSSTCDPATNLCCATKMAMRFPIATVSPVPAAATCLFPSD